MNDKFLVYLSNVLGTPSYKYVPSDHEISRYEGVLPNLLLKYWSELGWSGFFDGAFWLVNPHLYRDLLDIWIAGTALPSIDRYHVIARTSFGKLFIWGENSNRSVTINCPLHAIIALKSDLTKMPLNPDIAVKSFFSISGKSEFDILDDKGVSLFQQAIAKLGPLSSTEVYGFEPPIIAGGKLSISNLAKLDLFAHLNILRSFSEPIMPELKQ
jgi:hypothetical protein